MPQTLLALLALTLASAFTFTSFQRYATVERNLIRAEMGEMAGAIAQETLEIVSAASFGGDTFGNGATDCQQFGGAATCTELGDFHNQNFTRQFNLSGSVFTFDVEVDVSWRDATNPDSVVAVDTGVKGVEVTVYDPQRLFLPSGGRLERLFKR